jgi:hypothetical protein
MAASFPSPAGVAALGDPAPFTGSCPVVWSF